MVNKCEIFALMLISFIVGAIQSPLLDAKTSQDYLITRADVAEVLSKIIKPDDSIALLTDFDGTLGEINPNPIYTEIKPESKEALVQLVARPNIVVSFISGRPISNLLKKVGLDNVTYSGNHGMEILFKNKTEFHYPIKPEIYENCTKLKQILTEKYGCDTCGGWVEDKNISLVYHYGFVPEHLQEQMKAEVTTLVLEFGFKPVKSHSAIEIKPPVVWSKGHAAQLILNEIYGKDWHKNHRIIYLGDDTSDEDVMKILKGKSTTFRVTKDPDVESYATFKVQSVDTIYYILDWLVNNTISSF